MTEQQAVHDWIAKTIAANDVVLFMKGTSQFPQCGFSAQVAQILNHLGVDYKDVNVLEARRTKLLEDGQSGST